ncbi:hypothetical protein [Herminiimonas fonticola]|uniref:Integrase n=1 Tax=Herminiimonas fonticola TaxID=303380 RepID=A0A4R6FZ66_9BURK|nr:hypothetical protein [Herminiimonas fonticola]RBA24355.1 hypothetical protein Hfont_2167 [Herminiimonas fonticola]TDN87299.1 hypothetical protein EV677_3010 [Herminiimonas fonticola]
MSAVPVLPGLAIESTLVVPGAINFRPLEWPPARDWPVIVDKQGNVVSRFADSLWILDPWADRRMVLNFGDGRVDKTDPIDRGNADLLRIIASWWLYGPSDLRTARTLLARFSLLRPIFSTCTREGILASELTRFPLVVEKIAEALMPSMGGAILSLLHELYECRDKIGFELIDRNGLVRLAAMLPLHERRQTPYIPPRIWQYQVTRLQACLEDFLAHKNDIQACFDFCLAAYVHNYGSLESALRPARASNIRPFFTPEGGRAKRKGMVFHGPFLVIAKKFKIDGVLRNWMGPKDGLAESALSIDVFSTYLSMVTFVGLAYVLNFSLMRRGEAGSLRADCLRVEDDPQFGKIYLLQGQTSKTITDDRAIWVTAPSVSLAIDALAMVALLRAKCSVTGAEGALLLNSIATEPWASGVPALAPTLKQHIKPYSLVTLHYPRLFDLNELRIRQKDLELARLANPTLSDEFKVGAIWPLAWHQLRRTGAVNMQSSGLVSDASLQFQLKHLTRAMSLYYGQNYSRIRLEETSKTLYVQTMYEMLGREFTKLTTDRFVSPHGERRKAEIVRLISVDDVKQSILLAKSGGVACREIILGVCTNREPCPYGGIDTVAHCGGGAADDGKSCSDILYDRSKQAQVEHLERVLNERLSTAPAGSPLYESLEAQKRSVEDYYHATK